jgi:hypothetical protein
MKFEESKRQRNRKISIKKINEEAEIKAMRLIWRNMEDAEMWMNWTLF